MSALLELAERGFLPDPLIRLGIRGLDATAPESESRSDRSAELDAKLAFLDEMRRSPVALVPDMANRQHYEVPPEFFQRCWEKPQIQRVPVAGGRPRPGRRRGRDARAERAQGAELDDGQRILELGCGWGSLTPLDGRALPAQPDHGRVQLGPPGASSSVRPPRLEACPTSRS